jgi:branched-chain amino acid transport system ATP-binding protein
MAQRAATLSGGEKQMLALAMSLVLTPTLMLLDEPTLGLAPPLVRDVLDRVRTTSRTAGIATLLVEQKVREALRMADHVLVMRMGRVSFAGEASALEDDQRLREVYL